MAKFTMFSAALSILLGTCGPMLARFQLVPPMAGMGLFVLSGLVGFVAILSATIAAVRFQAYLPAMVGALGLLPLLAVIATIAQGMRYPAINDISTDLDSPPAFVAVAALPENNDRSMEFPADFAQPIREHYADLGPLLTDRPPERIYRLARDMATQSPFNWMVVRDDPDTLTFEAVAETRVFKWRDDIVVRVGGDGTGGSVVHMRSKSRDGKSDLGANARRIRRFLGALAE